MYSWVKIAELPGSKITQFGKNPRELLDWIYKKIRTKVKKDDTWTWEYSTTKDCIEVYKLEVKPDEDRRVEIFNRE